MTVVAAATVAAAMDCVTAVIAACFNRVNFALLFAITDKINDIIRLSVVQTVNALAIRLCVGCVRPVIIVVIVVVVDLRSPPVAARSTDGHFVSAPRYGG
jgi:hypothetical protein